MTDRELMQQALEALVRASSYYDTYAEIDALEAALAEPVPPIGKASTDVGVPVYVVKKAEPVAKVELLMTGGNAGLATRIVEIDDHLRERLRPGQLLYTAPPQRKPLTEEEIAKCWHDTPWHADLKTRVFAFARAIERAHGIGGSDE